MQSEKEVGASSAPWGVVSEEVAEELPAALRGAELLVSGLLTRP